MKNDTLDTLEEVLALKDRCYREVAHMPRKAALRKILVDADRAARSLGLKYTVADRPMVAAEGTETYSATRSATRPQRAQKSEDRRRIEIRNP